MTKYSCNDGNGAEIEIEAESMRDAAREYVDGGDWGTIEETTWVTVRVTEVVEPLYDASGVTGSDFICDRLRHTPETRCPSVQLDALTESDRESLVAYLRADDGSISDEDQELLADAADEIEELERSNEPESELIKISIDPDEPECIDGEEHEWESPYRVLGGMKENPGVWGSGGGVKITTVCKHCGRYCITDTWAQDPEDGEQGLESTRYEDADENSLTWVLEQSRDEIEAALEKAGLEPSNLSADLTYAVPSDNEDQSEEYIEAVRAALPEKIEVDWTGGGDTDGNGNFTSDIRFSLKS